MHPVRADRLDACDEMLSNYIRRKKWTLMKVLVSLNEMLIIGAFTLKVSEIRFLSTGVMVRVRVRISVSFRGWGKGVCVCV